MKSIKVFVADDHKLFREALIELLKDQAHIDVVGDASNGEQALSRIADYRPDIVLMDIDFGADKDFEGITTTQRIVERYGDQIRVIMLTMHNEPEFLVKAFEAGAKGYVLKESNAQQMLQTIREVYQGNVILSPNQATKIMERFHSLRKEKLETELAHLTEREKDILKLVSQGATNREIADELKLSTQTVRNRLSQVFSKLHVNNRTQAAQYASKLGLTDIE